jgi:transposase
LIHQIDGNIGGFETPMITTEVYMEIDVLKRHGFSLRKIAKEVGCAVNTVRRHLSSGSKPKYVRTKLPETKLRPYETYLRERQAAAKPLWIPATVLFREICERGYLGGATQLRIFLRKLRPTLPADPVVRFETSPGEQMQIDWVEFRKGSNPLYAFCATLGYSRASHVEFVTDMQVTTLIDCHQKAFVALGGVPRTLLYDNMKTVVIERDVDGEGIHRYHAGFLDYAKHCGFIIKLCRPYRARTKGKVERFNGYLRRSFYVPLATTLKQADLQIDATTANAEVRRWLKEIANERIHGTTGVKPSERLLEERHYLQAVPVTWRGDIAAARPQAVALPINESAVRPAVVVEHMKVMIPMQHPLAVYEQLLANCLADREMAA